jgi:hypothetical protein
MSADPFKNLEREQKGSWFIRFGAPGAGAVIGCYVLGFGSGAVAAKITKSGSYEDVFLPMVIGGLVGAVLGGFLVAEWLRRRRT